VHQVGNQPRLEIICWSYFVESIWVNVVSHSGGLNCTLDGDEWWSSCLRHLPRREGDPDTF